MAAKLLAQSEGSCSVTVLTDSDARVDVLNRLRRAEGQIRGIHRMVEQGEDCLKIGQILPLTGRRGLG